MGGNGREKQVWQRVMAGQEAGSEGKTLRFWAMEDEAAFRLLSEKLTGRPREQALGLLESTRRKLLCLNGLAILAGERWEAPPPLPAPQDTPRRLLENCYRRSVRSAAGFTAGMADRQFGAVYRHLAAQEEARCAAVAELLGAISSGSGGRSSTPR